MVQIYYPVERYQQQHGHILQYHVQVIQLIYMLTEQELTVIIHLVAHLEQVNHLLLVQCMMLQMLSTVT